MATDDDALATLRMLVEREPLAVLATHHGGQPHAGLVGFAASDDLTHLVFATPKATRKYEHIRADGRVAMLIDNRSGRTEDFEEAAAVTAVGRGREAGPEEAGPFAALLLEKHPNLEEFVTSPASAVIVVDIESYSVVTHFQDVVEFRIGRGKLRRHTRSE
jgi:hypothetical protein